MQSISSSKSESTLAWRQLRKTIGKNIHRFRLKRKLSLFKLAGLAQVHPGSLDLYEMGRCHTDLHKIAKIAYALKVNVGELMMEEK